MSNEKEAKEAKQKEVVDFIVKILVSRGMSDEEAKEAAGEIVTKGGCYVIGGVPVL